MIGKLSVSKETYVIHLWNEKWRREIEKEGTISYIKKSIYRLSAKLKKHSRIYLNFINFIKSNNKEKKISSRKKYNKDKIYSTKTLYGQLQRRYL